MLAAHQLSLTEAPQRFEIERRRRQLDEFMGQYLAEIAAEFHADDVIETVTRLASLSRLSQSTVSSRQGADGFERGIIPNTSKQIRDRLGIVTSRGTRSQTECCDD